MNTNNTTLNDNDIWFQFVSLVLINFIEILGTDMKMGELSFAKVFEVGECKGAVKEV